MVIIASLRITYFPPDTGLGARSGSSPHVAQGLLGGTVVAGVDEPVPDVAADRCVGQAVQAGGLLVSHHRRVSLTCPGTS